MRHTYPVLILLLAGLGLWSCGPSGNAPRTPDGRPLTIMLLFNNGVTAETPRAHARRLTNVGEDVQERLIRRLTRAGYQVSVIQDRSQFAPAPGYYLLYVEVTNYIYAFVSVTLNVRFDVMGTGPQPIASHILAETSTRGLPRVIDTINGNLVITMTNALSQPH